MVVLKKILDFYINSSLHVALSAFALVSMTQYFFGVQGDFSVAFFAFFGTVVGYNFVKYDAIARLNKTEIKKELKVIVFLSFISLLACFYFFFQLSWESKLSAFAFFGLTLLYTLPFFPNKQTARNWKGVKIYIVGITWVGVTVILPLVEAEIPFSIDVLLMAFQRFLLVFSIVLVGKNESGSPVAAPGSKSGKRLAGWGFRSVFVETPPARRVPRFFSNWVSSPLFPPRRLRRGRLSACLLSVGWSPNR